MIGFCCNLLICKCAYLLQSFVPVFIKINIVIFYRIIKIRLNHFFNFFIHIPAFNLC